MRPLNHRALQAGEQDSRVGDEPQSAEGAAQALLQLLGPLQPTGHRRHVPVHWSPAWKVERRYSESQPAEQRSHYHHHITDRAAAAERSWGVIYTVSTSSHRLLLTFIPTVLHFVLTSYFTRPQRAKGFTARHQHKVIKTEQAHERGDNM